MTGKNDIEKLLELIKFDEEYQQEVGIPNYLFDDLLSMTYAGKMKPQHIGFAYSYIYFITYMARYTKYEYYIPSVKEIKEILGYTPTNKTLDYIIKKDGILDNEGITATINDFPLVYSWEFNGHEDELTIDFASEYYDDINNYKKMRKVSANTLCKIPIFGFYQDADSWDTNDVYDGTFFYNCEDTGIDFTLIDFRVFAYCMNNPKELGCNAFYLYAYLKHKNDLFKGYNAGSERLANETGLSKVTVEKYRNNMRSYNMMNLVHEMEFFVVGLTDELDRKASDNLIHPFEDFTHNKIEYRKQQKIGLKTLSGLQAIKMEVDNEIDRLLG